MLPKDIGTSRNLLQERVPLFPLASLNAFLDNIVPIPVFHHLVEGPVHGLGCSLLSRVIVLVFIVVFHDFINDLLFVFVTAVLHALFYHVTSEFMVAESYHVALHFSDYPVFVLLDLAMF